MRQVSVYVNDRKAGVLTEMHPGTGYSFTYDPDYLTSDAPPVSVSLSKRNASYESASLFPFFANMLPEGANRKVICRTLRIDEHDLFGILTAMAGKDFIGGVHIKTTSK
ncbi:MAG: HipA N-terminal domain-containing protein [Bacteroidales bacterium]|nr:HipA N-terminal domain-containing protein [Bacteroidales bacterium]